jgi:hypothetical protein
LKSRIIANYGGMILRNLKLIPLIILILLVASCSPVKQTTKSFYYWKSNFNLQNEDLSTLQKLQIKRLYIRFFDVKWDPTYNAPLPTPAISFQTPVPNDIVLIPTIYITNETINNCPSGQLTALAQNIVKKVRQIQMNNQLPPFPEIQLDCDWTKNNHEKYFTLLKRIRNELDNWSAEEQLTTIELSATIRLHQIKYPKQTGIPPVTKGVLMCYNLGHPGQAGIKNSILTYDTAVTYLNRVLKQYPLQLDVALPIYSWGAVFQSERYTGLINNVTINSLVNNPNFKRINDNTFIAVKNTYLNQSYIYKNDRIRIDESDYKEVLKTAKFIKKNLNNKHPATNVIIYHFDSELIRRFSYEKLQTIFNSIN